MMRLIGFWFLLAGFAVVNGAEAPTIRPFSNKVIFSETPEIGKKWHGGIRMNDFVIWDGYWNINGWMTVDFLSAGFRNFKIDENGATLKDNFSALTLKAFPFRSGAYRGTGGLKFYDAQFSLRDENEEELIGSADRSTVLFITQDYRWREKHYFNLFTSLSFRKGQSSTYYFVPAYQLSMGKRWSFGVEYYMTNTLRLPIKILQYLNDVDKLDFYNADRELYSFMIWGFQYTARHLRVDLNAANHISFQHGLIPMLGVGWDF